MSTNDIAPLHPGMRPYVVPEGHPEVYCYGQTMLHNHGLDNSGFASDFEDMPNDDCVIPNRWSREWVGPADWQSNKYGYPICTESSVSDGPYRYVAKHRHTRSGCIFSVLFAS